MLDLLLQHADGIILLFNLLLAGLLGLLDLLLQLVEFLLVLTIGALELLLECEVLLFQLCTLSL